MQLSITSGLLDFGLCGQALGRRRSWGKRNRYEPGVATASSGKIQADGRGVSLGLTGQAW